MTSSLGNVGKPGGFCPNVVPWTRTLPRQNIKDSACDNGSKDSTPIDFRGSIGTQSSYSIDDSPSMPGHRN